MDRDPREGLKYVEAVLSNYPPAKPEALACEPLKAAN